MRRPIARHVFVACLAILALLDAVVLGVRIADVVSFGRMALFPAEGEVTYSLWKVMRHYQVYEWPFVPTFPLTPYNVLFYQLYGRVLGLAGVADDRIVVAGRFITLTFAAAGAISQFVAARWLSPPSRRAAGVLALLSAITWFGCALPGWWMLSIRPDIPATVFSALGMGTAALAFQRGRRWLVVSGLCFLSCWLFKQSQIGLFAATCVYIAFWRRSLLEVGLLTGPFAAGAATTIALAGPAYRANTLLGPSLSPWMAYLPLYWFRSVALIDLLLWGTAVWAAVVVLRPFTSMSPMRAIRATAARSTARFGADYSYPVVAFTTCFVIATMLVSRIGSALNHALEFHMTAGVLAACVLARPAADAPRRAWILATAALVPMLVFDAALLTGREQGRAATLVQLKVWGDRLHLATPDVVPDRAALAARMAELPAPVYTEDEVLALPWFSNRGRHPVVMMDHVFYDPARKRGLITTGVDGLFRQGYFGAAVLPDTSEYLPIAVRAGYRVVETVRLQDETMLRILVRR